MADDIQSLIELRDRLREFVAERDWEQFHSPKNLAMALAVEAAELMEHFQWLTADESTKLAHEARQEVRDELADVQIYLVRMADRLDIDLLTAVSAKLEKNRAKYPVQLARGSAKMYDKER